MVIHHPDHIICKNKIQIKIAFYSILNHLKYLSINYSARHFKINYGEVNVAQKHDELMTFEILNTYSFHSTYCLYFN